MNADNPEVGLKFSVISRLRSRTNVHYIVFHLTLADTITCFITLPMQTIWKIYIGVSPDNLSGPDRRRQFRKF